MDDNLTRAQHYRSLAKQMADAAQGEFDKGHRRQLSDLERQYSELANKLVRTHNESN